MDIDIDKIMVLVDKVAASNVSSLSIEEGSLKISIKKQGAQASATSAVSTGETEQAVNISPTNIVGQMSVVQQVSGAQEETIDECTKDITAPIVGTFYAAANPKSDSFVKVGDSVKKGQVIGLIEAMKLMNEIESDVDGIISEILVGNEQGVEYGQPLFKVKLKGM